MKKWSVVPGQIRTNNSLLFTMTLWKPCREHDEKFVDDRNIFGVTNLSSKRGVRSANFANVMLFSLGYGGENVASPRFSSHYIRLHRLLATSNTLFLAIFLKVIVKYAPLLNQNNCCFERRII